MDTHEPSNDDLLQMKIEDLLSHWPTAAQILIGYRMACLGCDFAKFHSTNQVLEIYDLDSDVFLKDLKDIRRGGQTAVQQQTEKE